MARCDPRSGLRRQLVPLLWGHFGAETAEAFVCLFRALLEFFGQTRLFQGPLGIITGPALGCLLC